MAETDKTRADRYEAAIRRHRDYRGDDRCVEDDDELYAHLPEGKDGADTRLHSPCEMMANCVRYIQHRHDPSLPYISPQREIESLARENVKLKREVEELTSLLMAQE